VPRTAHSVNQALYPSYALEEMVAGKLKSQFGGRRRIIPGRTANLTQAIGERAACQYRDACWLGCPYGRVLQHAGVHAPGADEDGAPNAEAVRDRERGVL
jgi:hypothetical protein